MLNTPLAHRTPFLVANSLAALSVCAQEQGPPPDAAAAAPARLPEVVVTATRDEEAMQTLPYSVSAVGPVDLQHKMPRTAPEALRELPSVMLQKTSHGQGSPFLRGFTGFRTLMLIDGIRLNNSTFRDGPNQYWGMIDALTLERMEVVRGPSSVLYGSDAIGGTVNAITTGPERFEKRFDWDGRTFYRYASAEDSHIARAEASGNINETFGFQLGGSLKEFGDLRGGNHVGEQRRTGYFERDWDAKFEYRINPNSRLIFGHQTVDLDDAWRTHSTIHGILWSSTTRGTDRRRVFDQNRDLDYLQYHAEDLEGFVDELHLSLSHHLQAEIEDRVRSSGTQDTQGVDVHTLGVSAQLKSLSPIGQWIYGVEYYRDWVDSFFRSYDSTGNLLSRRVQGPVADDATYDLAGAYVEDHLPFLNERMELILGGRFTYAALDANDVRDPDTGDTISLSDSWQHLAGNARLRYAFDEDQHWAAYTGVSQGFRAPNLSDLTRFDIARSGEQEIPAFGLDPEQFLSTEVGVKARYDRFTAEVAYFYTFLDDVIVRVPTGGVTSDGDVIVTKENAGEGFVHGVELAGSVNLHPEWTLWSNFTWMEGRMDTQVVAGGATQTEPVSRIMPTTVNFGLRWTHRNKRYWAEFVSTITSAQQRLSSNDARDTERIPVGGTPGYDIYHIRAGWNPFGKLNLTAAVENLTDQDYRIHGSGVNEPGRNLVLAADFRF